MQGAVAGARPRPAAPQVRRGLPADRVDLQRAEQSSFRTVGLPDAVVREAQLRVKAALRNSGFHLPNGHVVVNLLIGIDGNVKAIKVLEADPPGVFEKAVIQAVRFWRFEPAVYDSQPVEMWATLPVRFDP